MESDYGRKWITGLTDYGFRVHTILKGDTGDVRNLSALCGRRLRLFFGTEKEMNQAIQGFGQCKLCERKTSGFA